MPRLAPNVEAQLQAVADQHVAFKIQELQATLLKDKLQALHELAKELGYVVLTNFQHERLTEQLKRDKEWYEGEVERIVKEKGEVLNTELAHQLELGRLKNQIEVARLEERLGFFQKTLPNTEEGKPSH